MVKSSCRAPAATRIECQMISFYPPAIRRQLLSKHFLISTMPEAALDDLVKFTTVARFEPHRVIFSKGDKGDCLYGILSGRVRIYSNSAEGARSCSTCWSKAICSARFALLDGSTRTASSAAMEQADLLRIHRTHFLPYVKANPDLILAMLTLLCQRLRWTSSVIEDVAFLAFPARLAKRLLVRPSITADPTSMRLRYPCRNTTSAAWLAPAAKQSTSNSPSGALPGSSIPRAAPL